MTIPAYVRLKSNRAFGAVFRRGRALSGPNVVVHTHKANHAGVRLGVTVSRQVRTAVVRNRLKRRLRDAFYRLDRPVLAGRDVVLTAKPNALEAPFSALMAEIETLLMHAKACPPSP